jgi:hypothetical protein
VNYDGTEPTAEGGRVLELTQAFEGLEERVMNDVIGVTGGAFDAGGEVDGEGGVAAIEQFERLTIALCPEGDELGIREIREGTKGT